MLVAIALQVGAQVVGGRRPGCPDLQVRGRRGAGQLAEAVTAPTPFYKRAKGT